MDPITLTIGLRGFCAVLLILGGLAALGIGFVLFRKKDPSIAKARISAGKFTASAEGIGAVVMITAAAWGWGGASVLPKIRTSDSHQGTNTEVYALRSSDGTKITAPAFRSLEAGIGNTTDLSVAQFTSLFQHAVSKSSEVPFTIGDQPAKAALGAVSFSTTPEGVALATLHLDSVKGSAKVEYVLQKRGSQSVFVPQTPKDTSKIEYYTLKDPSCAGTALPRCELQPTQPIG
jgi:hypothetical protein